MVVHDVLRLAGDCSLRPLVQHLLSQVNPCLALRVIGHCIAYRALIHAGIEPPKTLLSAAITEPGGGSRLKAEAKLYGGRLRGEKVFVTNGLDSPAIMVYASTGEDKPIIAVVDSRAGVKAEPMQLTAYTCAGIARLTFDNVEPRDYVAGPEAKNAIVQALVEGRVLVAALALSLANSALQLAAEWVRGRGLEGRQVVTHRLAKAWAVLQAAEALVNRAAVLAESGRLEPAISSAAKYVAVEAALQTVAAVRRTMGGHAFRSELQLATLQRHIEALEPAEGTQDIQLEIIARSLVYSTKNRKSV